MNNNLIIKENNSDEFIDEINIDTNNKTNNKTNNETNNETNNVTNNETSNEFNTNCLALTIRKEYRLTIASNIVKTIKRVFFKILINFGMLNFFNMIF